MSGWTSHELQPDGPVRLEAELVMPDTDPSLALVLCHGLPSGSPPDPDDPGYPGLARHLTERGYASARFSFRGCYGSGGDLSMRGWIDDLSSVVRTVSERVDAPLVVVGSSLGGATALLEAPDDERVAAIATLAAPADFRALTDQDAGASLLARVRSIAAFRTPGFPADTEAWGREFLELVPADAAARLGSRPLLVVHGERDDVVPPEHADRIAASAPDSEVVLLPEAGHQLRRHPEAIDVLERWLARMAVELT
jgi:uncharacterized protein